MSRESPLPFFLYYTVKGEFSGITQLKWSISVDWIEGRNPTLVRLLGTSFYPTYNLKGVTFQLPVTSNHVPW